jgi:Ca2+-binding EF-hand superfamily protein
MSISALSTSWQSEAQTLLALLSTQSTSSNDTTAADTSASTSATSSATQGPTAAQLPPPPWASGQFSSQTLSSLLDGQTDGTPATSSAGAGSSDPLVSLVSAESNTPSGVASQLISTADTNGDGQLNLSEFETAYASELGDNTASGLTASQTAAATTAFNAIDTNGDGEVSQSELTTALQNQASAAQAFGPPPGPPPSASTDEAFGTSATDLSGSIISALDGSTTSSTASDSTSASTSGVLTLSEVENAYASAQGDSSASSLSSTQTEALTSGFNAIDANGDGQISVAELAAALKSFIPWLTDASGSGGSAATASTSTTV